jgi:hypothetical protein
LKQSRRVCRCLQPLHKATCPLSPCYFGEKRWPGSDNMTSSGQPFISAEERQFLDDLKPRPKWWAKAWGKR